MKLTDEIKAKIKEMRESGIGARIIAKELNLPLHAVNNYISRELLDKKCKSNKATSEAKKLVSVIQNLEKDEEKYKGNNTQNEPIQSIIINTDSIKSVLSFSEMQDEIDELKKVKRIQHTLIDLSLTLANAIQKGEIIDKDNLKQIRALSEAAVSISTIDRNSTIKIKEIAMTEAGVRSAELTRREVKNIDETLSEQENKLKQKIIQSTRNYDD